MMIHSLKMSLTYLTHTHSLYHNGNNIKKGNTNSTLYLQKVASVKQGIKMSYHQGIQEHQHRLNKKNINEQNEICV